MAAARRLVDPLTVTIDTVAVLVVDDQESFREALTAMIGVADGFRLAGAVASGDEAVAHVGARAVDLVLLDVNLGEDSGLEVCRVLLAEARAPKVVLMSAYRREELPADLDSLGVPFVAKDQLSPATLTQWWRELGGRERTEPG